MPNYFIKSESSASLSNGTFGNYTGGGIRYSAKSGTYEGLVAFKANESSKGGFGEFKYTSPKRHDISFESRTRVQFESAGNSITSRAAAKYSQNLDNNFSIYEIAGVNSKVSLEGKGLQSLTPVSLTGVGYNITPNLNIYAEGELSKSYNLDTNKWESISPSAYLGVKYTF